MLTASIRAALGCCLLAAGAPETPRFVGFNETTSTAFTGVFLAPPGSTDWGSNQALNDRDHVWDFGERLAVKGIGRGIYDLKVIDRTGRVCIKHGVDLTHDATFDISDADLRTCGQ